MLEPITNNNFNQIPTIKYGFFTKLGGKSKGIFESLNINSYSSVGESFENVKENLQIIQNYFSTNHPILKIRQHHSSNVLVLKDYNYENLTNIVEADAIVTKRKNLPIGISTADCIPLLFVDSKNEVIGATHSGWRGSIAHIIENTIQEMKNIGATNIDVLIGPHLRRKNFEIKNDFIENLNENNKHALNFIIKENFKMYFDITAFIKDKLKLLNITNIYDVNIDNYENENQFFSYRRNIQNNIKQYGTQFSGIMLK